MRDSYEGYVIYLFLALMIAYLGNGSNERVIEVSVLVSTYIARYLLHLLTII